MYFRARYYSPGLGRFVGRDPERQMKMGFDRLYYKTSPAPGDGYNDGWSLYQAFFVPGETDPSGKIKCRRWEGGKIKLEIEIDLKFHDCNGNQQEIIKTAFCNGALDAIEAGSTASPTDENSEPWTDFCARKCFQGSNGGKHKKLDKGDWDTVTKRLGKVSGGLKGKRTHIACKNCCDDKDAAARVNYWWTDWIEICPPFWSRGGSQNWAIGHELYHYWGGASDVGGYRDPNTDGWRRGKEKIDPTTEDLVNTADAYSCYANCVQGGSGNP